MPEITTYTPHYNGVACLCHDIKRFKRSKDQKGKPKIFIISNNIIAYKENLVESTGWLLKFMRRFSKNFECKVNLEF